MVDRGRVKEGFLKLFKLKGGPEGTILRTSLELLVGQEGCRRAKHPLFHFIQPFCIFCLFLTFLQIVFEARGLMDARGAACDDVGAKS